MGTLRTELSESLAAFRDVFRSAGLRRLELAYAGSELGDWGAAIALSVLAFDAGGATGVGILLVVRTLPAALAAPLTSLAGDRYDRVHVMIAADLVRAATLGGAAAVAVAGAPVGILYALGGIVGIASTAFRPAQTALLPAVARTPEELTAANVASSTIEAVAGFAGPAVGGVVLAAAGAGASFGIAAGTFLWSAALIMGVRTGRDTASPEEAVDEGVLRAVSAGVRTVAVEPKVRLVVGLFGAQTLVSGALNVLVVVVALDLLGTGESGLGALNAALGVGGVLGAAAAVALVGRRRLATAFGAGSVLWGAPIALLAVWDTQAGALVLLGAVGLANTIVDVAGFTLLQRSVPEHVLARVFGVLHSLILATVALGAIATSALVAAIGTRATLVAAGALLPVLVALTWRRLALIDAEAPPPSRELELLRGVPFLASLPPAALETLASRLEELRVAAGSDVVRQGEPGDRFYLIEAGEAGVAVDGESRAPLGPSDFFGEIALLRDVPRTATVTARSDLVLRVLERDAFIAAVTGHAPSADAAGAVVDARLGRLAAGVGPL